ncbi:MAG: RNase H-like domain-containing protein, partial [bacterium]
RKADALRDWPDPSDIADIVSFRAYANWIREYIPNFIELDAPLRTYTKKNAKFSDYMEDEKAQKAFSDMRTAVARDAALHTADYRRARLDAKDHCPLELYVDASDLGWGCTLAQRRSPKEAPRPIAVYNGSFNETERAWHTFERELCGMRNALSATEHLTKGFTVTLYTDHKNNLFTGAMLGNKRINKKLLRWSMECEEYGVGSRIRREWVKGIDNVLGDGPSRNPPDRDAVRSLPVPCGPVCRIIKLMFTNPEALDREVSELSAMLDSLDEADPDPTAGNKRPAHKPTLPSIQEDSGTVQAATEWGQAESVQERGALPVDPETSGASPFTSRTGGSTPLSYSPS